MANTSWKGSWDAVEAAAPVPVTSFHEKMISLNINFISKSCRMSVYMHQTFFELFQFDSVPRPFDESFDNFDNFDIFDNFDNASNLNSTRSI